MNNNESENSTELLRANQMQGTGNFDSDSKREDQKEERKGKIYTIVSSLILMIPISTFVYFYTQSRESGTGGEAVISFVLGLILPFLLLCLVASIILSMSAIRKKNIGKRYRIIALINIMIAVLPIPLIALIALIARMIEILM